MKVYLVEDVLYSPGYVYAVMASKEDANKFSECLNSSNSPFHSAVEVFERTLFYGQPPVEGYNE